MRKLTVVTVGIGDGFTILAVGGSTVAGGLAERFASAPVRFRRHNDAPRAGRWRWCASAKNALSV
jgi:hypothetical protein